MLFLLLFVWSGCWAVIEAVHIVCLTSIPNSSLFSGSIHMICFVVQFTVCVISLERLIKHDKRH